MHFYGPKSWIINPLMMNALNGIIAGISNFISMSMLLWVLFPFFLISYCDTLNENQNYKTENIALREDKATLQSTVSNLKRQKDRDNLVLEGNERQLADQATLLEKKKREEKRKEKAIAQLAEDKEELEQTVSSKNEELQLVKQDLQLSREQGTILLIEKKQLLDQKDSLYKVSLLFQEELEESCKAGEYQWTKYVELEYRNANLAKDRDQLLVNQETIEQKYQEIQNHQKQHTTLGIGGALLGMTFGLFLALSAIRSKFRNLDRIPKTKIHQ